MSESNISPEPPVSGPEIPRREPVLNLPGALVAVILFMAAIFIAQAQFLSRPIANWIDIEFGFIPARYVAGLSLSDPAWIWTTLTYSFLHGNVEHLVFNCLWLACFATPVTFRIGTTRSVIFWITSAIASAVVFAALHWGEVQLVIGASGVISAYMGAACRFAFPPRNLRFTRRPVFAYPLLRIQDVLRSRMAVSFLLVWLAGNLFVAAGMPLFGDSTAAVAWEAHIGGLLFGFFAFPLFERGVWVEVPPRVNDL